MADYLTPATLRDAINGNLELAEVATPREFVPVSAEGMRMAIDGEDYSARPAPEPARILLAFERIEAAITDATDLVNNYLRVLYAVPLAVAPSTVKEIMVRIVRYMLHDERATTEIIARYREAMQWLADIRDGKMVLDVGPSDTATPAAPDFTEGSGLYTVAGLGGFACPYSR